MRIEQLQLSHACIEFALLGQHDSASRQFEFILGILGRDPSTVCVEELPEQCLYGCRRSVRTGGLVAISVNLVVLLNFFVSYLHTTRTHRVYVLGTRKLPEAEANFTLPDPSASSYYQQWIQRDFQPWRAAGISTVSPASICIPPTFASRTSHVISACSQPVADQAVIQTCRSL